MQIIYQVFFDFSSAFFLQSVECSFPSQAEWTATNTADPLFYTRSPRVTLFCSSRSISWFCSCTTSSSTWRSERAALPICSSTWSVAWLWRRSRSLQLVALDSAARGTSRRRSPAASSVAAGLLCSGWRLSGNYFWYSKNNSEIREWMKDRKL